MNDHESLIGWLRGCVFSGWLGKIRSRNLMFLNKLLPLRLAGLSPISFCKKPSNFSFNKSFIVSHLNRVQLFREKLPRNCAWPRSRKSISHLLFMGDDHNQMSPNLKFRVNLPFFNSRSAISSFPQKDDFLFLQIENACYAQTWK